MDISKNKGAKIAGTIAVVVAIAAGAFYSGMHVNAAKNVRGANGFANLTPEQRQARMGTMMGGNRSGMPAGARGMGGFIAGEVLSNDGKSITIKLRDGGSKIVFLGEKTQVSKATQGSSADLVAGTQVTVTGGANQDGSLNADSVQIRPAMPATPPTSAPDSIKK